MSLRDAFTAIQAQHEIVPCSQSTVINGNCEECLEAHPCATVRVLERHGP